MKKINTKVTYIEKQKRVLTRETKKCDCDCDKTNSWLGGGGGKG